MADLLDDDASNASLGQILSVARLWADFRTYYLLLALLVAMALATVVTFVALGKPVYTATAIVGPADNSDEPFGQGMGGALSGGLGGIAKHLHVGGALGEQGLDDTFDEYSSLLTSNRLSEILVRKHNILPELFPDQWDAVHRRWLTHHDLFHDAVNSAKLLLHRPVKTAPDQDDLEKYFEKNLVVDPSLETSFATVSFRFHSPEGAARLLGLVLREADNIIRQDKRRDVAARIAYLNSALEHLSLADQKPELIDILSDQEQEMMMIESNRLYASTLIDSPHAPLKPTSPSPVMDSAIAFALACFAWLGLVRMTPAEGRWSRIMAAFARPRRHKPAGPAKTYPADPLADALRLPPIFDPGTGSDPHRSS